MSNTLPIKIRQRSRLIQNPIRFRFFRKIPEEFVRFSAAIGGSAGNLLQVWVQNAAGTAGQAISLGPGQTNFEYDVLGRLHKVTDADTSSVIYNYDPAGNRQTVTATKN